MVGRRDQNKPDREESAKKGEGLLISILRWGGRTRGKEGSQRRRNDAQKTTGLEEKNGGKTTFPCTEVRGKEVSGNEAARPGGVWQVRSCHQKA